MDSRQWPMSGGDVPVCMDVHARVCGILGKGRRALLCRAKHGPRRDDGARQRLDEEPDECHDQLQRRLPPVLLLSRGNGIACGENNKAPRSCLEALNPENSKAPRSCLGALNLFFSAERTGFEPANRFCRLHAFQACLFNHSSTSPKNFRAQRYKNK